MATTSTVHAQLIRYATNGDQIVVNLKSAGSDISIDRSSNTNLPSSVTTAQTLANSLGALAFKNSLAKGDVGLGNVDNTADVEKEVKHAVSAGYISLTACATGGDGNTEGYRLLVTQSISTWSDYKAIFAIRSKHQGTGILSVTFGCNSDTLSYDTTYGEIKYFGLTDSVGAISEDSFQIYISSDGSTAYLFAKYLDWSNINLRHLDSDFYITNGTWVESITSTYGKLKAKTQINAASSAIKLDTATAGSATQPVYFSDGKPVATTYTLGKSVPSDAVFTDTTYSTMTGATATSSGRGGLVPAPGIGKNGQFLRGDGQWATPASTTYSVASTSTNGLMSSTDKAKLDFGDIVYVSNQQPTKACIWVKLD